MPHARHSPSLRQRYARRFRPRFRCALAPRRRRRPRPRADDRPRTRFDSGSDALGVHGRGPMSCDEHRGNHACSNGAGRDGGPRPRRGSCLARGAASSEAAARARGDRAMRLAPRRIEQSVAQRESRPVRPRRAPVCGRAIRRLLLERVHHGERPFVRAYGRASGERHARVRVGRCA